jgi:hypothetical protein
MTSKQQFKTQSSTVILRDSNEVGNKMKEIQKLEESKEYGYKSKIANIMKDVKLTKRVIASLLLYDIDFLKSPFWDLPLSSKNFFKRFGNIYLKVILFVE